MKRILITLGLMVGLAGCGSMTFSLGRGASGSFCIKDKQVTFKVKDIDGCNITGDQLKAAFEAAQKDVTSDNWMSVLSDQKLGDVVKCLEVNIAACPQ